MPILTPTPPLGSPYARPSGDIQHTQLRRRILDGQAADDQRAYVVRRIGPVRAMAWGQPTRTSNPLRDLSASVSVLYEQTPVLTHTEDVAPFIVDEMTQRLRLSSLWSYAAEAQHLTEALNEAAIRVDLVEGRLRWRVVTPDLLEGVGLPDDLGTPGLLREWRVRTVRGEPAWYADELNVLDEDAPHYRVLSADSDDVTEQVLGQRYDGDAYPYRYSPTPLYPQGRPYIPYSLRHSQAAPRGLFSPWWRVETVDGTLEAGLVASMIAHVTAQASFPTTVVVGARPMGATQVVDDQGRPVAQQIILDPSAIQFFEALDPQQQPVITVLRNETDVLMLQELAERQAAGLTGAWGLSASDIQRTAADSRSGVALMVSDTGRRRMQAARAPVYQPHDERLVGMVAALLNSQGVGGITDRPESGWGVRYTLSPLSPMERSQRLSEAAEALRLGLFNRAEARAHITGEDLVTAGRLLPAAAPSSPEPTPAAALPQEPTTP